MANGWVAIPSNIQRHSSFMALYSIEYFRCIVYTVRAVREPVKSHVIGGLFCVYFDLGALRNVLQKQYFIIYLFIAQNYLDSENQ